MTKPLPPWNRNREGNSNINSETESALSAAAGIALTLREETMISKKTVRTTLIVIAVLVFNPATLILGWIGMMLWGDSNPERGENQAHVDWLPETASDISYYRSYSRKVSEFSMNESDFRKWASGSDLKEITDRHEIRRFSWWEFQTTRPKQYDETYFREERHHIAVVTNGLFASYRQSDGGGNYRVFDRDKNRVYFESNRR